MKFIERSYFSNNILPNRDLGLSLSGDLLNKKLNYAVGIFNDLADGGENTTAQDINSQNEYSATIFITPFAVSDNALRGLGFGVAGTVGNSKGIATSTKLLSTQPLLTSQKPMPARQEKNLRGSALPARLLIPTCFLPLSRPCGSVLYLEFIYRHTERFVLFITDQWNYLYISALKVI